MMGLARRATAKTWRQKMQIFLKFKCFQIFNVMALHEFQLREDEDETKNGINFCEHNIILSSDALIFAVHPDFTDKEIQSHPSRE
jgi:hypothetical protein